MRDYPATPIEMVASLWRNRSLIVVFTKREVVGRYRGSLMGVLWSFFNPVFMLIVYTFVFSVVFKARWSGDNESRIEFALVLFAGMIVFGLFSECVNRAPSLVLANSNYVKKVVFPLEILPFVSLGAAAFHLLVNFTVWMMFYLAFFGLPHSTVLLLPFVLLPVVLFTLGLSWMLASVGVYLRDIGHLVGVLTTALLFLSPIFYPVNALPVEYQQLLHINPLTPVIEQTRELLVWGKPPKLGFLTVQVVVAAVVAWLGFSWFQKTRKGFADVL